MSGLEGRVAIVTGAGQGIGRILARAFAERGATAMIAELDPGKAGAVADEIAQAGGKAIALPVDVADANATEAMAARVLEETGRIDVLINNAAIFSTLAMRPFDEIPLDEWERVLRVNVTGAYLCTRAVAPAMRAAGWGRIVNMGSGAVTLGRPNYLHYIASKGAVEAMSRSLARELGPHGITVNTVLPGATFTEVPRETVTPAQKEAIVGMQCVPRPETPEDLVGTILFLASDDSAFLTGQAITVDGGATHR